jgi:hypothetical protein
MGALPRESLLAHGIRIERALNRRGLGSKFAPPDETLSVEEIAAWADGIDAAQGTEFAPRVSEKEAIVSQAIIGAILKYEQDVVQDMKESIE